MLDSRASGQAESATGKPFAKYWLHNGLTRFNTKKISKSDPEFERIMTSLQLTNLLEQHSPELLRFLILRSHYRSPIDFSDETLQSAKMALNTFYRLLDRLQRSTGTDPYNVSMRIDQMRDTQPEPVAQKFMEDVMDHWVRFLAAMDDDFNVAGAVGVLFDMAGCLNRFLDETRLETHADEKLRAMAQAGGGTFMALARLLGLLIERPATTAFSDDAKTRKLVDLLVEVRKMARQAKQFEISDHVRDQLTALGIVLEDRPDGTQWRLD